MQARTIYIIQLHICDMHMQLTLDKIGTTS